MSTPDTPSFPLIRPATLADLGGLRLGLATMLQEHQMPYPHYGDADLETFTASMAQRLLSADPTLLCFVAVDPAQPFPLIGFTVAEICSRPIGQPARYLMAYWLYVQPGRRHEHIGWALCTAVMDRARDSGITAVEICAKPGDDQWARRGWTPVATTFALTLADVTTSINSRAPATTTEHAA